jgi:hypothetical protein
MGKTLIAHIRARLTSMSGCPIRPLLMAAALAYGRSGSIGSSPIDVGLCSLLAGAFGGCSRQPSLASRRSTSVGLRSSTIAGKSGSADQRRIRSCLRLNDWKCHHRIESRARTAFRQVSRLPSTGRCGHRAAPLPARSATGSATRLGAACRDVGRGRGRSQRRQWTGPGCRRTAARPVRPARPVTGAPVTGPGSSRRCRSSTSVRCSWRPSRRSSAGGRWCRWSCRSRSCCTR